MDFQNFVLEAIDRVLTWEIPDDVLGKAVSDQIALMARIGPEHFHVANLD